MLFIVVITVVVCRHCMLLACFNCSHTHIRKQCMCACFRIFFCSCVAYLYRVYWHLHCFALHFSNRPTLCYVFLCFTYATTLQLSFALYNCVHWTLVLFRTHTLSLALSLAIAHTWVRCCCCDVLRCLLRRLRTLVCVKLFVITTWFNYFRYKNCIIYFMEILLHIK